MNDDRLRLDSIVCRCRIGVTEEERSAPQKLEIDLDLHADLEAAGRSSRLEDTIDYRDVHTRVRDYLEQNSFRLVEAAARGILDLVLARFPVSRAVVRVRKFVLPGVAHVEVRMERARPS